MKFEVIDLTELRKKYPHLPLLFLACVAEKLIQQARIPT